MSAGEPRDHERTLADLGTPDPARRRAALERLLAAGAPLEEPIALAIVECLRAPVKVLQRRAADALAMTTVAARPRVAAALRTACQGPEAPGRWGAAFALARLGLHDVTLVAPVLAALDSRDGDQRWAAAAIMVECGRRYPDVVLPALRGVLGAPRPELRKMALYVLRDLAPGTPEVTAAVIASLRDPDVGVRLAALSALCRLEPLPPAACDLVLGLLRDDPDPGLRRAATNALGHVGHCVAGVGEVLAEAARSSDPGLRRAAAAARRRLDPDTRGGGDDEEG